MIDWTQILLALIGTLTAALTAIIGLGGLWLKWKLDKSEKLVNGRVDELVIAAEHRGYVRGHSDGRAGVCDAIAKSSKISVDAQGMAEVMSQTAVPKEKQ